MKRIAFGSLIVLLPIFAMSNEAATVAYYRFENGSNLQPATTPILDQTGANPLTVEAGSNATFSSVVPTSVIPQTGAANDLSMDFTSRASLVSNNASFNDFAFPTWTIEAYVDFKSLTGFQTFIGKDGVGTGGADLYFQRNARNSAFSILYTGSNGAQQGFDGNFVPVAGTWYHVAAVDDGSTLSLYVNGVLDKSIAITAPLIERDTPWTIGRGYFSGPTDTSDAYVDEVRFSNTALTPSQFLDARAVPEPSSVIIISCGILCIFGYGILHRAGEKAQRGCSA